MIKRIAKSILRPLKPIVKRTHLYQKYTYKCSLKYLISRNLNKTIATRFVFFNKNKIDQYADMFKKIRIELNENSRFQYWIDEDLHFFNVNKVTDSQPPKLEVVLQNSIDDLITQNSIRSNNVQKNNYRLLLEIKSYIKRVIKTLSIEKKGTFEKSILYFKRMLTEEAESLEEAFQRILFWTSIFWQTGHMHVGLGRLDKILSPFNDLLPEKETVEIIKDFFLTLHTHYVFKSASLLGDTGQIIILGGTESNGSYFCNQFSYCFIKALKELELPDPKILLRVNTKTPNDMIALVAECNATGIGCPLLSNDDVIIPALEKFGYTHEDALNYVTSACWEPFGYGNSLGPSNLDAVNFAKVLESVYKSENFLLIKDYENLVYQFEIALRFHIKDILLGLDKIRWENNPLMSLFTKNCAESGYDISEGGAVHSDYGILSVGMANVVDSLLNIKHLVFEKKEFSLEKLKFAAENDFADDEILRKHLFSYSYFGHENEEVLQLVERLTGIVSKECTDYKNYLGGKVKFGLSAPNYMEEGEKTGATFDGRHCGKPLSVHISAKLGEPYTELVNFAGKIDYSGNRCNGNVVDFFVSPLFIQNNFDKFCLFLRSSIKVGFFQMQMNVVSSETLIAAKKNPELYPNLIVRVWGFSAYFKDLPEQYKDVLIQRALYSERAA